MTLPPYAWGPVDRQGIFTLEILLNKELRLVVRHKGGFLNMRRGAWPVCGKGAGAGVWIFTNNSKQLYGLKNH
jgi:hypothetical protein